MSRRYQEEIVNESIRSLLDTLADQSTDISVYRSTMHELGRLFGQVVISQLAPNSNVSLACTVEDADFLAFGLTQVLESNNFKVHLNVFWNKREKIEGVSIAPILRQYSESNLMPTDTLIIVKSIISNACVVRTNLTRLIEQVVPKQIFVLAPVLLQGSVKSLEEEFPLDISKRFNYLYFAVDSEKSADGFVSPGIGGDVYKRLGFENQKAKNSFVPQIVKDRRQLLPH